MNGALEEVYEGLEKAIKNLPTKEVQTYLKEQIISFFTFLRTS
jgi:hypothetical protein